MTFNQDVEDGLLEAQLLNDAGGEEGGNSEDRAVRFDLLRMSSRDPKHTSRSSTLSQMILPSFEDVYQVLKFLKDKGYR